MATTTTLFLWSEKQNPNPNPNLPDQDHHHLPPHEPEKHDQSKPRGRRKPASTPKKPPQRGLGVAQLERLRIQEQLRLQEQQQRRKLPDLKPAAAPSGPFHAADRQVAVARLGQLQAAYGAGNNGGYFPTVNHAAVGSIPCIYQPYRSEVILAANRNYPGGGGGEFGMKELSSNQNMLCWSDQCEHCVKRKRLQNDQYKIPAAAEWTTNGCDFLGRVWAKPAVNLEKMDMDENTATGGGVVGLRGRCVGEKMVMEYNFFPSSTTTTKETITEEDKNIKSSKLMKNSSHAALQAGNMISNNNSSSSSPVTVLPLITAASTTAKAGESSSPPFLDLSLRLYS